MGVLLKASDLNRDSFQAAVHEVLSNPSYTTNAKKIQFIITDQPMKSKDLLLYWVNYTIRHNGAKFLISEAPFELNALQYWSVDVVAFLLGVPVLVLMGLTCFVRTRCSKPTTSKEKVN